MSTCEKNLPDDSSSQDPKDTKILFTPFRRLPTELRIKIWQSVDHKPHIIRIFHYLESNTLATAASSQTIMRDSLLLTNHEARNTTLENYKLLGEGSKIRINLSVDIIAICCHHSLCLYLGQSTSADARFVTQEDIKINLKYLMIDEEFMDIGHVDDKDLECYKMMKGLKTIILGDYYGAILTSGDQSSEAKERWNSLWNDRNPGEKPKLLFISEEQAGKLYDDGELLMREIDKANC